MVHKEAHAALIFQEALQENQARRCKRSLHCKSQDNMLLLGQALVDLDKLNILYIAQGDAIAKYGNMFLEFISSNKPIDDINIWETILGLRYKLGCDLRIAMRDVTQGDKSLPEIGHRRTLTRVCAEVVGEAFHIGNSSFEARFDKEVRSCLEGLRSSPLRVGLGKPFFPGDDLSEQIRAAHDTGLLMDVQTRDAWQRLCVAWDKLRLDFTSMCEEVAKLGQSACIDTKLSTFDDGTLLDQDAHGTSASFRCQDSGVLKARGVEGGESKLSEGSGDGASHPQQASQVQVYQSLRRLVKEQATIRRRACEEPLEALARCEAALEQALCTAGAAEVEEVEAFGRLSSIAELRSAAETAAERLGRRLAEAGDSDRLGEVATQCRRAWSRLGAMQADEEECQRQRLRARRRAKKDGMSSASLAGMEVACSGVTAPTQVLRSLHEAQKDLSMVVQSAHAQSQVDESPSLLREQIAWSQAVIGRDIDAFAAASDLLLKTVLPALHEVEAPTTESIFSGEFETPETQFILHSVSCSLSDVLAAEREVDVPDGLMSKIASFEERADSVGQWAAVMLRDLEAMFEAQDGTRVLLGDNVEREIAVLGARWRTGLAIQSGPPCEETQVLLRHMVDVAQDIAVRAACTRSVGQTSPASDFTQQRKALLEAWHVRLEGIATSEVNEAEQQHAKLQDLLAVRRNRKTASPELEPRPQRWPEPPNEKQLTVVSSPTVRMSRVSPKASLSEVRSARDFGASAAFRLLRQCNEETEQQSQSVLRRAELRRERLGLSQSHDDFGKVLDSLGVTQRSTIPRSTESNGPLPSAWAWPPRRQSTVPLDVSGLSQDGPYD